MFRVVISSVNGGLGIANLADRKHAVVIDAGMCVSVCVFVCA